MKKTLIILCLIGLFLGQNVFAKTDTASQEYLQGKKHFAILNPLAESIAESAIKKAIKKETGAKFDVKLDGYTLSSMKKGVFRHLELTGNKINIDEIYVPYLKLYTTTDYNYIDITKDPVVFMSDVNFDYNLKLSEESINGALSSTEYKQTIDKINKMFYPLFVVEGVKSSIKNNMLYLTLSYNFPLAPSSASRIFTFSTDFNVYDGKIVANKINIENSHANISARKVAGLINLLDPLSFTLKMLNTNKCKCKVDSVKIVSDIIQINGRILIKGEN